jgi:hypothetical protein
MGEGRKQQKSPEKQQKAAFHITESSKKSSKHFVASI